MGNSVLTFSLIVATLGRSTELENLFRSLAWQGYPSFECIIVDQNRDDRVKSIVRRWNDTLNLRVIDATPGLSHARNAGLAAATGDIIAFPDDDCWYSSELLSNVSKWFESHAEFSIFTVGALDLDNTASGNRWVQNRCEIRPRNAFRTTFSPTIFIRRTPLTKGMLFDETVGVGAGSRFGSGEETDLVLGLLGNGARGYFDRTWHVGHPKRDMLSGTIDARRAITYGAGMGYVLRKRSHHLLAASFLVYDLARSLIVAARGSREGATLCMSHAMGIAEGYFQEWGKNGVPFRRGLGQ
jgi:glycosyltransferase involved in cell wall biosynthesis